MVDCLFCKIASGEVPADIVFQDDEVVAFRDINPAAPAHVLVIPRKHIASYAAAGEADRELLGKLALTAAHIAQLEGIRDSGFRTVVNTGSDANQTVPHLHLHVLGGRRMGWPPG